MLQRRICGELYSFAEWGLERRYHLRVLVDPVYGDVYAHVSELLTFYCSSQLRALLVEWLLSWYCDGSAGYSFQTISVFAMCFEEMLSRVLFGFPR